MSSKDKSFYTFAFDPELRTAGFRTLQSLEADLPVHIHHASIRKSIKDLNSPNLFIQASPIPGHSLDTEGVRRAVSSYSSAAPFQSSIGIDIINNERLLIARSSHALLQQTPVTKPLLIVSPFTMANHAASYWGSFISPEIQNSLSRRLIDSLWRVTQRQPAIKPLPGQPINEHQHAILVDIIRAAAIMVYNANSVLPGKACDAWSTPADIVAALDMLRFSGIDISEKDRLTLLNISSEAYLDLLQGDKTEQALKATTGVTPALKRLCRQIDSYAIRHLVQHPRDAALGLAMLENDMQLYIQGRRCTLANVDPSVVAVSSINALDGRICRFNRLQTLPGFRAIDQINSIHSRADEDQPLFSF